MVAVSLKKKKHRKNKPHLLRRTNTMDSRSLTDKPLIVTTNLTLEELQNPEDTPRARIYDRLLEMCSPVCFTGENFRKATAQEKMERLKTLMNGKESL